MHFSAHPKTSLHGTLSLRLSCLARAVPESRHRSVSKFLFLSSSLAPDTASLDAQMGAQQARLKRALAALGQAASCARAGSELTSPLLELLADDPSSSGPAAIEQAMRAIV